MPDLEPRIPMLSYARPDLPQARRWELATLSIVVAFLSLLWEVMSSVSNGLYYAEFQRQIRIGRIGGACGGSIAIILALASCRQLNRRRWMSRFAVTLSAIVLYLALF
jgi:hypothetical protein